MERGTALVIFALTALGCGSGQNEPAVVEGETSVAVESTAVEALIVGYQEDLLQVEQDDGTKQSFDATELEVLYPESLTGKKLFICHSPPADPDSLWRKEGARIVFELTEEDLQPVGCALVSDEAVEVRQVADE